MAGRYVYQLLNRRTWKARRVILVSDFRVAYADVEIKIDPNREVTRVKFSEKVLGFSENGKYNLVDH